MFGHRPEGRRVRDVDPIVQITPYLMPMPKPATKSRSSTTLTTEETIR